MGRITCRACSKQLVDQLTQIVQSVSKGRIILDQAVMEGLTNSIDAKSTLLKDLSPREQEVLSWMAKGYRGRWQMGLGPLQLSLQGGRWPANWEGGVALGSKAREGVSNARTQRVLGPRLSQPGGNEGELDVIFKRAVDGHAEIDSRRPLDAL